MQPPIALDKGLDAITLSNQLFVDRLNYHHPSFSFAQVIDPAFSFTLWSCSMTPTDIPLSPSFFASFCSQ